jgi:hypothetical protein
LQDLSPADRPARRRRLGGRSSLMICPAICLVI